MHHKRRRPKNRRAGCLMCKYWKVNGVPTEKLHSEQFGSHRRRINARKDLKEYLNGN